jgi:hypothetical protein
MVLRNQGLPLMPRVTAAVATGVAAVAAATAAAAALLSACA